MADTVTEKKALIWRPDANLKWRLYRNNDKSLPPRLADEELQKAVEKSKGKDSSNPFYALKERKETKGAMVYTPKGYGIIQNVKLDTNTITVRVAGVVEEFSRDDVTNEIPVSLTIYNKGSKREEIAIFSIQSTAKDVLEKIEEGENDGNGAACQIFWKGRELPKTNENLEKLGFAPLCKVLVTTSIGRLSSVTRYSQKYSGWYFGSNSIDGISFSPSKDVRVAGFGIYVPEGDNIAGNLKFNDGEDCQSGEIYTTDVSLSKDMETEPDTKVYMWKFDKPYRCKAGQKYTCRCRDEKWQQLVRQRWSDYSQW